MRSKSAPVEPLKLAVSDASLLAIKGNHIIIPFTVCHFLIRFVYGPPVDHRKYSKVNKSCGYGLIWTLIYWRVLLSADRGIRHPQQHRAADISTPGSEHMYVQLMLIIIGLFHAWDRQRCLDTLRRSASPSGSMHKDCEEGG